MLFIYLLFIYLVFRFVLVFISFYLVSIKTVDCMYFYKGDPAGYSPVHDTYLVTYAVGSHAYFALGTSRSKT